MRKILITFALLLSPFTAFAALAHDGDLGVTTTSGTNSVSGTLVTASGPDDIVIATHTSSGSDDVTGCTVDGTSATQLVKIQAGSPNNQFIYLYNINGISAGSHTVACSRTGASGTFFMSAVGWSGADQTTQPDVASVSATNSGGLETINITTSTNNAEVVGAVFNIDGNSTAGTGVTQVGATASAFEEGYSTSLVSPAGSFTFSFSYGGSRPWGAVAMAIRPASAVTTSSVLAAILSGGWWK